MPFSWSGALNAVSTYNILNLRCVYQDITPPKVEEHLCSEYIVDISMLCFYNYLYHCIVTID